MTAEEARVEFEKEYTDLMKKAEDDLMAKHFEWIKHWIKKGDDEGAKLSIKVYAGQYETQMKERGAELTEKYIKIMKDIYTKEIYRHA